jgi:hypothetical protein
MNNYSDSWGQYPKIIEEIKKTNRSNPKYLELKKLLFETYELYYNMNNTINPLTVKTLLKNWLNDNCFAMTDEEKTEFIKKVDFSQHKMVKNIVDCIISEIFDNYCGLSCSELTTKDCKHRLAYEIVKCCNKFISFPRTDSNIEIFLNGSTMYLEKEISQKDYFNSPIEEIMYEAIQPIVTEYGYTIKRECAVRDIGRTEIRYALDLAIFKNDKLVLDIETDGLQFHRDYQAMASDRQRDRWLLMRGIPTVRFTSREIFDDLDNCLIQIQQILEIISNWNKG